MRGARRSRRRHPNAAPSPAPLCPPFGLLPRGGGLRWRERPTLRLRKWRGRRVPRRDTRPSPQRPSSPTMPVEACPDPVEACPEPVEACPEPVEGGGPKPPGAGAPGRRPDLRVNVPKCPRMSHYFAPSTRKLCNLRVRNLTFWAHFRPFWPISGHFLCPGPLGLGRTRRPRAGLTSNAPTGDNGGRRANRPQEAPPREAKLASHSRSTFLKNLS